MLFRSKRKPKYKLPGESSGWSKGGSGWGSGVDGGLADFDVILWFFRVLLLGPLYVGHKLWGTPHAGWAVVIIVAWLASFGFVIYRICCKKFYLLELAIVLGWFAAMAIVWGITEFKF